MKKLLVFLLILFGVFIGGSYGIGVYSYATNGYITASFEYSYETGELNDTQDSNFRVDIGDVYINYNETNMEETLKASMKVYLNGPYLQGKSYTDFFNPIVWQNTSNTASLILEKLSNKWPGRDNWFYRDGNALYITLRTDLTYNISIFSVEGNIRINAPENTNLKKLDLKTSIGKIQVFGNQTSFNDISLKSSIGDIDLNFTRCQFGGNINSSTYTGDVNFNSYNPYYLAQNNWEINTTNGDVKVFIYQHQDMNSNVNGFFKSEVGNIVFSYSDNSTSIGAQFTGSSGLGITTYESEDESFGRFGNIYKSIDYETSANKYTMTMETNNGYIVVDAKSSPD